MSAPSRLTRQRETLVERARPASAGSPGRACPARRTTQDGRVISEISVVAANGPFASMARPVLSSISMRCSEARNAVKISGSARSLSITPFQPASSACAWRARSSEGAILSRNGCSALRRERQVVGLHRRRSRPGCACRSCRRTAGCAGRGNGFVPVLAEGRLMVVGDERVVGVEGEAGGRIVELRQLLERERSRSSRCRPRRRRPAPGRRRTCAAA